MKFKYIILLTGFLAELLFSGFSIAEGDSFEGHHWYLGSGTPDVSVTVVDSKIMAKAWSNIPSIELQTINTLLLSEHADDYVMIKDYNSDGVLDVGVMKGSGYGGSNACYAVYEYDALVYSYRNKASMTVCQP